MQDGHVPVSKSHKYKHRAKYNYETSLKFASKEDI